MDIYIDFKSPAAYLALKPTLALLADFAITAQWRPYRTQQKPVPAEKPEESRGETHIRVREIARRNMHLKYAGIQGTAMRFPDEPGQTDLALCALMHVQHDPVPFIDAAFTAYWVEHADLANPQVLGKLLSDTGYDTASFDPQSLLVGLEKEQLEAEQLGVVDTPAYVLAGTVFIGREHLPWIRELLSAQLPAGS